jgi:hypothetical protein
VTWSFRCYENLCLEPVVMVEVVVEALKEEAVAAAAAAAVMAHVQLVVKEALDWAY